MSANTAKHCFFWNGKPSLHEQINGWWDGDWHPGVVCEEHESSFRVDVSEKNGEKWTWWFDNNEISPFYVDESVS